MKTKKVKPVLVGIKGYVEQYPFLGLNDNKLSLYTNENPSNFNVIPQELILVSLEDEKIEVGDTCFNESNPNDVNNNLIKIDSKTSKSNANNFSSWKKVIARQSQIPLKYIFKFIEQYNNGCIEEDLEILIWKRNIGNQEEGGRAKGILNFKKYKIWK